MSLNILKILFIVYKQIRDSGGIEENAEQEK